MFGGNNDLQVYKDFFKWTGKPEMFKLRKGHILEYADLAPLAYLHMSLDENTTYSHIKHLLIDEMQDYSPIQFKVIQKLYPCRKTILGDACQSVKPLRFIDSRNDSQSICSRRGHEIMQKLSFDHRNNRLCPKDTL